MKGPHLEVTPLGGIDERIPQGPNSASLVQNYTAHPRTLGWDNRIGYEPYIAGQTGWSPFSTLGRIDSVYAWTQHQGARETILFESAGVLYVFVTWGTTWRIQSLGAVRPAATPNEPVTTYTPYGRYLIICDGRGEPLRLAAWPYDPAAAGTEPLNYPLGFQAAAGAPTVWGVDINPTAPSGSEVIGIFAGDSSSTEVGLGSTTADVVNSYRWRLTYVSNTGGESPISESSNRITWSSPPALSPFVGKRWVAGLEIPTGPPGTVARRIYRTKNLGDGDAVPEAFYFVDEIPNNVETWYYDHRSDNQLGLSAPGNADSVVFPAQSARFSAVFKNCLFVDGGTASDTQLFWSVPGSPDQFAALSFADLGGRDAGGITGLHAHYNFLVVLRERGIDIVRGDYSTGFEIQPMSASLGSRAVHTMTTIPDLGVLVLCRDGVYLIGGNVDGGGSVSLRKVSGEISETIRRMNPDVLARAYAAYSHKWREWHCYFAVDGSNLPNIGIVYHVDKGAWSHRVGFPVSSICADQSGELVFGHSIGDPGGKDNIEAGLFVISRRRGLGSTRVNVGTQENPVYALQQGSPPTSIYRSAWQDFGDPRVEKSIKHIYLHCITTGNNAVRMTVRKNYGYSGVNTAFYYMQRPEHTDQYVYDTATINGTTVWEEGLLSTVRFDVADGKCSHFQWEVETTNDLIITGYTIEFTMGGQLLIAGKRAI